MLLSEFVPHGAPELIEGASTRLARSTAVASAIVALLVVSLGAAMLPRGRAVESPVEVGDVFIWLPPPTSDPPPITQVPIDGRPPVVAAAEPVVVPDRQVLELPGPEPAPVDGPADARPGSGPVPGSTESITLLPAPDPRID